MRKIFAILLVALFMAGSVCFAGPTGPGDAGDILGQGKYPGQPHKVFRLVHVSPNVNDSDGIAAGSVVVWDDVLDDGVSVETTTTSGDARVAGILVTTVVSDDVQARGRTASEDEGLNVNWGWLQTYGLYAGATAGAAAPIAANDAICAGATAGSVSGFRSNAGVTTNAGILGCALDTAAASGTLDVFITRD